MQNHMIPIIYTAGIPDIHAANIIFVVFLIINHATQLAHALYKELFTYEIIFCLTSLYTYRNIS